LKKSRPGDRYAFIEPLESLAQALVLSHGSQSNWTHQTQGKEDVAVCLDVLEHIHDDSAFLKNYEKSLSNATTLILTVPALPCLSSNWDKALGHERRYTRSRLRSVLEGAGFEIIEIHYIFQSMIFPALLRKFQSTQNIESAEFPSLPDAINSLMTFLLKIENRLLGWLPFGTSLVAVVRKKNATRQN
jgi:2-polyprenyl-3-methyl-5-hydroxy-6-metoxy-1,4-benzoquinol methylase